MGSERSTNESRVKKRSDHRQQAGIQGLLIHAKERKYSSSLRLSHNLTRRKVKLTQQKARKIKDVDPFTPLFPRRLFSYFTGFSFLRGYK